MAKLGKIVTIAGAAIVIAALVLVAAESLASHPNVGAFDRTAAKCIRKLCGNRSDCQVRLRDLTTVDFDNFYEWTAPYSTTDISTVTGSPYKPTQEDGRVIVLMKQGRIAFQGTAEEGVEQSLAGEVFITCNTHSESFTTCTPDALFQVSSAHEEGDPARGTRWSGTSYFLTQIN
jgi:hypothetical protein